VVRRAGDLNGSQRLAKIAKISKIAKSLRRRGQAQSNPSERSEFLGFADHVGFNHF